MSEADVRALIKKSTSKDLKTADEASDALSKVDERSFPAFASILKKGRVCERVAAAGWMIDLKREDSDWVPAMTHVARGESVFDSTDDMMCRRNAAFLLAFSTDGIEVLTQMLRDGDLFERRSAIFAFDDLTETSNYPEGSLPAMKEAIPIIAKGVKEKDKTVSCMSDEVLRQIARGSVDELSKLAQVYLKE